MRATQFFEFIGRITDSGTHDGTVALPPPALPARSGR